MRYSYKSQRKEIMVMKRSAEQKIVGFRVVLTAIGHCIIASREKKHNYVPDELLQRSIKRQMDLYEANKTHPRYHFIEKYKKYWANETEKRNRRLHDYFRQKINAFTDFWEEHSPLPEHVEKLKEDNHTASQTMDGVSLRVSKLFDESELKEVRKEMEQQHSMLNQRPSGRPMSGLEPPKSASTADHLMSDSPRTGTPMTKSRGLSSGESVGKFSSDEDSRSSVRIRFTPDSKQRGEVTFKTEVRTVVIEEGKYEPSWSSTNGSHSEYETVPMNDAVKQDLFNLNGMMDESSRVSTGRMKVEMDRDNEEFEKMRDKMLSDEVDMDSDTTASSELSHELSMDEEERKLRSAQWGNISGDDTNKVMLGLSNKKRVSPLLRTEGKVRSVRKLRYSGTVRDKHNKLNFTPPEAIGEKDVFAGKARERLSKTEIVTKEDVFEDFEVETVEPRTNSNR